MTLREAIHEWGLALLNESGDMAQAWGNNDLPETRRSMIVMGVACHKAMCTWLEYSQIEGYEQMTTDQIRRLLFEMMAVEAMKEESRDIVQG